MRRLLNFSLLSRVFGLVRLPARAGLTAVLRTVALAAGMGVLSPSHGGAAPPLSDKSAPVSVRGTDLHGDPLPEGAVARMGSARFRHTGLSDYVCLPGGKTVLTAGSDRVLRLGELASGRPVSARPIRGKAGPGRCVTLSPDGKTLAAFDEGKVMLWEVASGKELKTLPAPKTPVGYLYFSPDGKTLAVGRPDWRVSFWEWQTAKERAIPLPFHPRPVVEFNMDSTFHGGFSPDGKWFVAGASCNEPLGVFEVATGREVHRISCHAFSSTVSPDSKRLAVSSYKNDRGGRETVVRLFDLASGKETAQFPLGHGVGYISLAFAPDGKTLACGFSDRSCLLDCATGRVLHRLTGRPLAPSFSPDGKILIASTSFTLRLWDATTGKELQERPGNFGWTLATALSQDRRVLAAVDWMDQAVSLWDFRSGRLLRRLPLKGEKRYVRNLGFSADGKTLVASQYKGFLQFWDVATGKEQRTLQLTEPGRPNPDLVFFQLHVSADG